jgi:hypothetical protein
VPSGERKIRANRQQGEVRQTDQQDKIEGGEDHRKNEDDDRKDHQTKQERRQSFVNSKEISHDKGEVQREQKEDKDCQRFQKIYFQNIFSSDEIRESRLDLIL